MLIKKVQWLARCELLVSSYAVLAVRKSEIVSRETCEVKGC
jgi:hypothetical protein